MRGRKTRPGRTPLRVEIVVLSAAGKKREAGPVARIIFPGGRKSPAAVAV